MTEAFCTLAGRAVAGLRLVNAASVWFADVDLEDDGDLPAGPLALVCQGSALTCSVDPSAAGVFGLQRRVRVVAGAGGWSSVVPEKGFQSDSGVKARTVAEATAREVKETIGDFLPARSTLAVNWERDQGSAGSALTALAGGVPWWVDYTGVTHVRARPVAPAVGGYEVLHYEPRNGVAQLAVDDLTTIRPGSVLTERLDTPLTVQAIEIKMDGMQLRAEAMLGIGPSRSNVLEAVIESIVSFFVRRELPGLYRYRVIRMAADGRVDLQAVSKGRVPDALLVPQWPGVGGAHSEFTEGAIVAVAFIDGDRQLPALVAAQGVQGPGFVPKTLTLGAPDPKTALEVAFKGATVKVLTPPAVFQGTIVVGGVPSPAVGAVVWPSAFTLGTIEVGSTHVKVGP